VTQAFCGAATYEIPERGGNCERRQKVPRDLIGGARTTGLIAARWQRTVMTGARARLLVLLFVLLPGLHDELQRSVIDSGRLAPLSGSVSSVARLWRFLLDQCDG